MSAGAAVYAEAAVLGAVLQDPRGGGAVRSWLKAEDFADAWNREIYRALVDGHLFAHPEVLAQAPQSRTRVLSRLVVEQLHRTAAVQGWQVSGADWSQVARYLTSLPLPASVPDAARAADYGRVVAQASLERTVGASGEFAERAVLAAVLARPQEAQRLRGWLRAEDFTDPWMGQMYRLLVEERLCAHPAVTMRSGPEQQQVLGQLLYERLRSAEAAQGWKVSPTAWPAVAAQIGGLLGAHQVPHPEQAAQLGQRVLQSSIALQVAEGAQRVERTLETPGALTAEMEVVGMLGLLQRLEDRWEQAMGRPGAVGASMPPPQGPRRPETAFTEDAVLGSLLRDPGQVAQVAPWLQGSDFTQPGRAELYASIQAAAAGGGTVDPVLVVWDAHRRGGQGPEALGADQVWEIHRAGRPGLAGEGGRILVQASITHHVRSATSAINAAAGDPTAAPGAVIGTARGHLQRASLEAARLTRASWSTVRSGQGAR